jgi:hypothetical protein
MLKQVQHDSVLVVTKCHCHKNRALKYPNEPYALVIPAQAGIQTGRYPGSRLRITWNLPERIIDFEVLSCDGIIKIGELRTP